MTKEEKLDLIKKVKSLIECAEINIGSAGASIDKLSKEYDTDGILSGFNAISSEMESVNGLVLNLEEEIEQESE